MLSSKLFTRRGTALQVLSILCVLADRQFAHAQGSMAGIKPSPGRAQQTMSKGSGDTYDLFGLTDTPFEEAVRYLFQGGERRYRIDPAVTAYRDPISFRAANVTFDQLLALLLKAVPGQASPLTYRMEKGVHIITLKNSGAEPADDSKPIGLPSYNPQPTIKTVSIANERPGAALQQMFMQAGVSYIFVQPASVAATPHLTLAVHDVPLEQAVVHLLRFAPVEPPLRLQTYESQVLTRTAVKTQTLYAVTPDSQTLPSAPIPEMRCWFDLHDADFYDAFKTLMAGAGQTYSGVIPAMNVTVSGSDMPLEQALNKLLAAAPKRMQSHTRDGILYIEAF